MRFTIGQLLLVFPAFFISVVLVSIYDNRGVTCRLYGYQSVQSQVRRLQFDLNIIRFEVVTDQVAADAQNWLDGTCPNDNPFKRMLGDVPEKDPWGNPYRLVNSARLAPGMEPSLGVYSTGQDGISKSNGNDPDDLNSWDYHGGDWYHREIVRGERIRYATQGAYLTPFVFVGLLTLGAFFKRSSKLTLRKRPRRIVSY